MEQVKESNAESIKPYKESSADYLCGNCYVYIPFDVLNDKPENAPKYCQCCGFKIGWDLIKKKK